MGKKTRIAAWAMREEVLRGKTQEEMLSVALEKIDAVAGYKPDLICFPEIFLKTGGDISNPRWREIGTEMLRAFSRKAQETGSYILTSYYEPSEKYPDFKYNCAVLLDRQGRETGRYRKVHTVYEESTVNHVLPGSEYPVFETDFGKIGVQTCFDIGWREDWQLLEEAGLRRRQSAGHLRSLQSVFRRLDGAHQPRAHHRPRRAHAGRKRTLGWPGHGGHRPDRRGVPHGPAL